MDNNVAFFCRFCTTVSNTLKSHLLHQGRHRHLNKKFQCGIQQCKFMFQTENALRLHIIRSHNVYVSEVKSSAVRSHLGGLMNDEGRYCCPVECCGKVLYKHRIFMSHLRLHLKEGVPTPCPYQGCNKKLTSWNSLTGHLSRNHKTLTSNISLRPGYSDDVEMLYQSDRVEEQSTEQVGKEICSNNVNKEEFQNLALLSLAQFYLKLECKYFVPESTVQYVADELETLLAQNKDNLFSGIKTALSEASISEETILHVMKCVSEKCDLAANCNELRTIHKRKIFYTSNLCYVAPEPVPLCDGKCFYYVPIASTISALFKNKSFTVDLNWSFPKDGNLNDFTDGEVFQKNTFFTENPSALKLILYQDAFELCTIGPARNRKHKILAVYMAFGNLPPHVRYQKEAIQLVALCREKEFSHDKVYGKIVEDLQEIQNNGIDVSGVGNVKAGLAFICGDNLGSHSLAGLNENFSSSHFFCRYCLVERKEFIKEGGEVRKYPVRTVNSYNESLQHVTRNPRTGEIKAFKGVKFNSVFNKLEGFHVCSPGLPPCLGHDLNEGVIANDVMLFLRYFIKEKWFSLQELNYLIETFPYSVDDTKDKPSPIPSIDAKRVPGAAWQVWTLFRLLPLIVKNKIHDVDNPVWQCMLQLIEICEITMAPALHVSYLPFFQNIIDEYLITRKELFDVPLLPKHHYLSHYPDLVVMFGPLMKVWTLRFESKHTFFKRCWKAIRNSKNLLLTLSQRHELHQCLVRSGECVKCDFESGDRAAFCSAMYSNAVVNAVNYALAGKVSTSSDLQETDRVIIKGIVYSKGTIIILNLSDMHDKLDIGIIMLILISPDESCKFVVHKGSAYFNSHIRVYQIRDFKSFICIDSTMLVTFYPCSSYVCGVSTFIRTKHALLSKPMGF